MENKNIRSKFTDVNGASYDIPARNLLMSKLIDGNLNFEMVFEGTEDAFENIRVVVSADTARKVEALARKAMRLR